MAESAGQPIPFVKYVIYLSGGEKASTAKSLTKSILRHVGVVGSRSRQCFSHVLLTVGTSRDWGAITNPALKSVRKKCIDHQCAQSVENRAFGVPRNESGTALKMY